MAASVLMTAWDPEPMVLLHVAASCGCFMWLQTDKKYQLADWRVRPLPLELLVYARMDTHYLLYIYDCLKVELQQQQCFCCSCAAACCQCIVTANAHMRLPSLTA